MKEYCVTVEYVGYKSFYVKAKDENDASNKVTTDLGYNTDCGELSNIESVVVDVSED